MAIFFNRNLEYNELDSKDVSWYGSSPQKRTAEFWATWCQIHVSRNTSRTRCFDGWTRMEAGGWTLTVWEEGGSTAVPASLPK
jgi:hypothetical protein